MYRTLGLCLALSLTPLMACDGDNGDNSDLECEISVTLFPGPDVSNAYYRSNVEASFTPSQIPAGATITVTGPDGEVSGSTETAGRRLVFTPSSPLAPNTDYSTTVTYDCEGSSLTATADWSTSAVGESIGDLTSLQDNAYALNLADANFIEPEGVGGLIGQFLEFDLLVGIAEVDVAGETITMVGALGVEGESGVQEPCVETIPFPPADISENPYFEVGPQQFSVNVSGTEVTIEDLFLAGSFAPDGSYIDGVVLSGVVDTRPFADLVSDDEDAEDDAVCNLAESLGIECVACPDGTGDFCISLLADRISAEAISTPVEIIDDICDKPECADDPVCEPEDDSDEATSDAW